MPQSDYANRPQFIVGERCKKVVFDGVLFERISVLAESKGIEPLPDRIHGE